MLWWLAFNLSRNYQVQPKWIHIFRWLHRHRLGAHPETIFPPLFTQLKSSSKWWLWTYRESPRNHVRFRLTLFGHFCNCIRILPPNAYSDTPVDSLHCRSAGSPVGFNPVQLNGFVDWKHFGQPKSCPPLLAWSCFFSFDVFTRLVCCSMVGMITVTVQPLSYAILRDDFSF
jgi:hypothetical protein